MMARHLDVRQPCSSYTDTDTDTDMGTGTERAHRPAGPFWRMYLLKAFRRISCLIHEQFGGNVLDLSAARPLTVQNPCLVSGPYAAVTTAIVLIMALAFIYLLCCWFVGPVDAREVSTCFSFSFCIVLM